MESRRAQQTQHSPVAASMSGKMGALPRWLYVVLPLFTALAFVPQAHAALRDWRPSDFRFVTSLTNLGGECSQPQAPWPPGAHAGRCNRHSLLPLWDGYLLW